MARTTYSAANNLLSREGLEYFVDLFSKKNTSMYKDIAKREQSTKQRFIKVGQVGDMGMVPSVGQLQGIPFDDFQTPYTLDVYHVKRAVGFAMSSEALEEDMYGEVRKYTSKIARAFNQTKEQAGANMINLASATDTNGPDGVPWADASHPLEDGSVYDNEVTDALSVSALESAVQRLKRHLSHRGLPMPFMGPFDLFVPPELELLARRIVESPNQQGTANNDVNVVGPMLRVKCNPYFTSTTAWALKSANADEQGAVMLNRRPFKIKEDNVPGLDGMAYYGTEIYNFFQENWRGFEFSTGTG
jgi:hypothetical protein